MSYLLDTDVLAETKKLDRAAPAVRDWFRNVPNVETFISVMVLGEIRETIKGLRRRDFLSATSLEGWLIHVAETFALRTLPVTPEIADLWGRLCPAERLPAVDGLMAATALVHDLTLVTRNTRDFERSGARLLNPFVG